MNSKLISVNGHYNELINNLSLKLKIELNYVLFKKIQKISYFYYKSKYFIGTIGKELYLLEFKINDLIFIKNNFAGEIYFIWKGKIDILGDDNKIIYSIEEGNYFGEWDIFFNNSIRRFTSISSTNCLIYCLKKKYFKNIYFKSFIQYKQEMISNSFIRFKNLQNINKNWIESKNLKRLRFISRYVKDKNINYYKEANRSYIVNNKSLIYLQIEKFNCSLNNLNLLLDNLLNNS